MSELAWLAWLLSPSPFSSSFAFSACFCEGADRMFFFAKFHPSSLLIYIYIICRCFEKSSLYHQIV